MFKKNLNWALVLVCLLYVDLFPQTVIYEYRVGGGEKQNRQIL